MSLWLSRFAIPAIAVFLLHNTVAAQTSRGTVTGLVIDAQKGAISNAKVDLTGIDTNIIRTTRTNESGLYRFDAVDPGAYKLTVQSTGFRTAVAAEFTVAAAQVSTHDTMLEVGDVQQVLEVSGSSVALQVEAPVRGGAGRSRHAPDGERRALLPHRRRLPRLLERPRNGPSRSGPLPPAFRRPARDERGSVGPSRHCAR